MRGLGILLALCTLFATGCGGGSAREEEAAPSASAASRPPAPPIEGVSLGGERVALADFRGKPVFVNVWSSW